MKIFEKTKVTTQTKTQPVAAPKPEQEPVKKPIHYQVFNCEWHELAQVLNDKDGDGRGTICAVWTAGSAVHVVMKV